MGLYEVVWHQKQRPFNNRRQCRGVRRVEDVGQRTALRRLATLEISILCVPEIAAKSSEISDSLPDHRS
jgi:hypothetical protein